METIKTKVRRWGNSFGIVIPKEVIKNKGFKEGEEVLVDIRGKGLTVGEIMEMSRKMGLPKRLRDVDTQKALDEIDRELEPELFEGK
jgi:antitoxin component of MazEF toxin-antitoxin module